MMQHIDLIDSPLSSTNLITALDHHIAVLKTDLETSTTAFYADTRIRSNAEEDERLEFGRRMNDKFLAEQERIRRKADIFSLRDDSFVSIRDVMGAHEARKQMDSVVHPMVRMINDTSLMRAKILKERVEAGELEEIPSKLDGIGNVLPEQKLYMLSLVSPVGSSRVEMCIPLEYTRCVNGAKMEVEDRVHSVAGRIPAFQVVDSPPGSGKTMMVSMAAMLMLSTQWSSIVAGYESSIRKRKLDSRSGLLTDVPSRLTLSRVCIAMVPKNLMKHWEWTATSVASSIRRLHGVDVRVQVGKPVKKRGGLDLASVAASGDVGLFWILPLGNETTTYLCKMPEYAYVLRIIDEFNISVTKRYEEREASPLFNIGVTATPHDIAAQYVPAKSNPFTIAVGGEYHSLNAMLKSSRPSYGTLLHAMRMNTRMVMFTLPDFLRTMLIDGIARFMPVGVHALSVRARVATLASAVEGLSVENESIASLLVRLSMTRDEETIALIHSTVNEDATSTSLESLLEMMDGLVQEGAGSVRASTLSRVVNRLRSVMNQRDAICPITLETIPPHKMSVLSCCTGLIHTDVVNRCGSTCPLCRGPLRQVATLEAVRDPNRVDMAVAPTVSEEVRQLDGAPAHRRTTARTAVTRILQALVREVPTSPRALVCMPLRSAHHGTDGAHWLKRALDDAGVVGSEVSYTTKEFALSKYRDTANHRRLVVLLLDSGEDRRDIQGLDLHMTHLTVLTTCASDSIRRQAMGRALRMRARPENAPPEFEFPAKYIVHVQA